ncbi:HlyD family secretion protein [Hydrogenovibrio kuenenii]|uniref:HlyD family secretion protein n=1 Tax=Hydrogenovibrio kuenenii TaxID=63658 RepID=UPI000462EC9E|nr:HlyD family secretion protein [Hydrogenovibrio kuenenii]
MVKRLKLLFLLLLVSAAVAGGYAWLQYRAIHPSTSDAYVEANRVYLSPQVEGAVSEVLVRSYQQVKKGQLLMKIDDSHYQLTLSQAQAQVALSKTQATSAEADEKTAQAQAREAMNEKAYLLLDYHRIKSLTKKGLASQQQADDSNFKLKEAVAKYEAAESEIAAAQAHLQQAQAQIAAAQVAVDTAKLNISHTLITAPADGFLGQVDVRPGKYVAVGEKLFPMIGTNEYWVSANFKETDLNHIKLGQSVAISLDMYPDQKFTGRVESISPASGVAFSLIPSENATGNWVKVTQRFPVRIQIVPKDNQAQSLSHLRIGSSATVTIDTQSVASQPTTQSISE